MRPEAIIDCAWADGHMPAIASVLKQNAMHMLSVNVASGNKDLKQATDLVITVDKGDVAVRIRRPEYRKRWQQLTIRAWRVNDIPTELHKIRNGWCKWYLYAWSDGKGNLQDWMLIDLDNLRQSGLLDDPPITINSDGVTGFCSFGIGTLRLNNCLVSISDGLK